jgi:hypothetical protein
MKDQSGEARMNEGTATTANKGRRLCATTGWLLGVALLLTGSTAALAETTTLICPNPSFPNDPPFTIGLDEAQGTVTWSFAGKQYVPAYSNTYSATFDAREIKFVAGPSAVTVDRVTGNASIINGTLVMNLTCHVGKPQF